MTRLDNPLSFKRPGRRTCRPCVSSSPSEIPYGGFSPVRLQAGLQPQPSSRGTLDLYAATVQVPAANVASCEASRSKPVRCSRPPERTSPEALGSPAGYAVPPGRRLLWPHPSLSASPAGLCIRQQVFAYRPRPRGSPLYSACPSLRAVSRTPADRSVARGYYFTDRSSLHHLRTGSASAFHASWFTRGSLTRLQSSLHAAARSFAGPSPTRAFTFELSPRGSPHRSVEYNYVGNNQFPRPDSHRLDTQPCGLRP